MPFDGAGFPTDDRLSNIDQVIDLLATPTDGAKELSERAMDATASAAQ